MGSILEKSLKKWNIIIVPCPGKGYNIFPQALFNKVKPQLNWIVYSNIQLFTTGSIWWFLFGSSVKMERDKYVS